jgi:hypothetical protein
MGATVNDCKCSCNHNETKLNVLCETRIFIMKIFLKVFVMEWNNEELDDPAVSALGVRSRQLSNVLNGQS